MKVPAEEEAAVYHCISRIVLQLPLFDSTAQEVFRKQIWQISDYCGVDILTYAILSNHFHILLRVPQKQPLSDKELLRRYAVLYPKPTPYRPVRLDVIAQQLAANTPYAINWRAEQLELMGDVSQFMKLLKQRFSNWYNHAHGSMGTLWSGRFKSALIEPTGLAVEAVAAYIDLNAVRAGLVDDPKDYRFCGYAEAVAGHARAQQGLCWVFGGHRWSEVQAQYRQILFATGAAPREGAHVLSSEDFSRVVAQQGKLPLGAALRCRLRYFSDGIVLGERAFVERQFAAYRVRSGLAEEAGPRPLPPLTDWGPLSFLGGFRRSHAN